MDEPGLEGCIIDPRALSASQLADWERLGSTVPALGSPFLSAHYAQAVADAGVDTRVCVLSRDGVTRGFFAFQFANRMARQLGSAAPLGAAMSDYVGLVAAPDLRLSPARLLQLAQLNHFGFSHLDASQCLHGLNGEQPRIGLRIRLDTGADDPLAILLADRHKYRKDTERRARQLVKEVAPLRFEFDLDGPERALTLGKLIEEKRAQYQRTGAPDALAAPWQSLLLHNLGGQRAGSCRGILSCLWVGDDWLAMHFGIMGNGILQYWLPVYNPAFAKFAPGRLLIHHVIGASVAAGFHTIDRGEGDTPSKRETANDEHQYLRGVWHNDSLSSRLTRGYHSLKWRLDA
ncbi:MAG: GNAT family N-acetyltransferase [Pseudomonadota bacterium]